MRLIGLAVILALGLLLGPGAVEAQRSDKVARIGYLVLSPLVDPPSVERAALLDGLRELGYIVGRNIFIAALLRPRPPRTPHVAGLVCRDRTRHGRHGAPRLRPAAHAV
jgi:hypothetical protein